MTPRSLPRLLLVAPIIPLATTARSAPLAGPVVNLDNNHSYFLLPTSNWTTAEAQAVAIGGHLATINNAAENQWVYSTFSHFENVNRNLWIGLRDPDPNVNSTNRATRRIEFVWTSGETPAYTNWSPFEPNNPDSGDPTNNPEYFVHLWQPGDPFAARWNNLRDAAAVFDVPLYGVVEIPALPGDANFDGRIDRDDLTLLDRGRALNLSGWSNGDFTGDGAVTPADYTLLLAALAPPHSPSLPTVPEPAPLTLLAPLTLPLLSQTRRKPKLYN